MQKGEFDTPLSAIQDYLFFEVLGWEFDLGGYQYNNWSLRDVMETMPRLTRDVPDFDNEFKKQKTSDNPWKEYLDKVYKGGRLK